jgi:hypothetical protein
MLTYHEENEKEFSKKAAYACKKREQSWFEKNVKTKLEKYGNSYLFFLNEKKNILGVF